MMMESERIICATRTEGFSICLSVSKNKVHIIVSNWGFTIRSSEFRVILSKTYMKCLRTSAESIRRVNHINIRCRIWHSPEFLFVKAILSFPFLCSSPEPSLWHMCHLRWALCVAYHRSKGRMSNSSWCDHSSVLSPARFNKSTVIWLPALYICGNVAGGGTKPPTDSALFDNGNSLKDNGKMPSNKLSSIYSLWDLFSATFCARQIRRTETHNWTQCLWMQSRECRNFSRTTKQSIHIHKCRKRIFHSLTINSCIWQRWFLVLLIHPKWDVSLVINSISSVE